MSTHLDDSVSFSKGILTLSLCAFATLSESLLPLQTNDNSPISGMSTTFELFYSPNELPPRLFALRNVVINRILFDSPTFGKINFLPCLSF